ncbi:MAG TPA: acyl carrier protein [Clostridiales bacterium]|jgi:methoxymalonate biosynthesis acyl carrier protein|nr:acyl carrier protein [Clostridiales bacterium]
MNQIEKKREIEQELYDFIKKKFDIGDDPEYTVDVNLFDYGFVDSLGAFEIITFAEETWGVKITQRDLTLFPMNTIEEIAEVISKKL